MKDLGTIQIQGDKGIPKIHLRFGYAQLHNFQIGLWGESQSGVRMIANSGKLTDDELDGKYEFFLGESLSELDGKLLLWSATVWSAVGGDGELFSIVAKVTQGDNELANTEGLPDQDGFRGGLKNGLVSCVASWKLQLV